MRVFISHSSADNPAVEKLALSLRERGIDTWLDRWEISTGSDFIARINAGLAESEAAIIVFSDQARESPWVQAEVSYLIYARVQEGKLVIPIKVTPEAWIPPLLRPVIYRGIDEHDAIADAIKSRKQSPPPVQPLTNRTEQVIITLATDPATAAIHIETHIGSQTYPGKTHPKIPPSLAGAQAEFLRGFRTGLRRSPAEAARAALESSLANLGRELCDFCLTADSAAALTTLCDGAPLGAIIEICFEAATPQLLALPFEALRLPDQRLLAIQPAVVVTRRPANLKAPTAPPLPGPIKILVAVGAPDEDKTSAAVLDLERELQNILDALTPAQRHERCEVRILEVGHPKVIAAALQADAYHVLHLSCHGLPGALELEDEEGRAVRTTAAQLLDPIRQAGRALPMVLLNSCHGGVEAGQAASFAEQLLRAGVPAVLAMQTSVSDHYATQLARAFYENLTRRELMLPARALAEARLNLEAERQKALEQQPGALDHTQPEYATPSLFVAAADQPLADFALDKQPLHIRPIYNVAGPVPQLRIDDLIGRRKELRDTLRALRDPKRTYAGVVLTGIGGTGKSAVAGRAMQRLSEDGWLVPAHAGRFNLAAIALAIATDLLQSSRESAQKLGTILAKRDLDDRLRFQFVAKALAEERMVLVLDDFEQNLAQGGGSFLDTDTQTYLETLTGAAREGRLLITSRYPVPGAETVLLRVRIGPLSPAETRKLLLRLEGLRGFDSTELAAVLRDIGGHPRMLEFLDALLRGGQGRLPHVTSKLRDVLAGEKVDPAATAGQLDESLQAALVLGARDVFLEELLAIARRENIEEALLQVAVSNLPVTPAGLARMLVDGRDDGDEKAVPHALARLEDLSLVHRFPEGEAWVHRWTAQGLAELSDASAHRERSRRAGRYRWWRAVNESHSLDDAIEAVRNFLTGQDFDSASVAAQACFEALSRFQQSVAIAALASEILETLPESHGDYAFIADEEAKAHLALGFTDRAFARYQSLIARHEQLVEAEPAQAVYQRDLSVFYNKVGDLYRDLGQGEQARQSYLESLAIAERLAKAEPDRADYQRDLSVSYNKVGDLYRALGQGEQARQYYQKDLAIAERLAKAEPDRADYQRDLSVSYERVGDLHRDLGQGEQARQSYLESLAIRERLAKAEPDRADYQRDLSVSYNKVGDLYRALGQGEQARQSYLESLAIAERLAKAEPDRADYQRDLSVSYNKVGDLYRDLGQGEQARQSYLESLAIFERLAKAEPDRADYQRDLSVSYNKVGDLYRALGQGEQARQSYLESLAIAERLAKAEPDRADYQRDLSVSYNKVGDLYRALGQGEQARQSYLESLAIAERLAKAEPDRADYQRDLSVSYNKVGDLYRDLGQGVEARQSYLESLAIRERLAKAEPDRADYQRDLSVSYNKVGDLYRDLGQGEQARQYYLKDLAIAERLGKAEPDRADYQRDLMVSYVRTGDLPGALSILEALKSSGRLSPTDEQWLTKLRELVRGDAASA